MAGTKFTAGMVVLEDGGDCGGDVGCFGASVCWFVLCAMLMLGLPKVLIVKGGSNFDYDTGRRI